MNTDNVVPSKRPMTKVVQEMRLFSPNGEKLYLTDSERKKFMAEVRKDTNRNAVIVCTLLNYTGARPSEIRELTADRVHPDSNEIVIRSAKKRKTDRKGNIKLPHFRTVPIPETVMTLVTLGLDIRARHKKNDTSLLWPSAKNHKMPIDAKTIYNWVKNNMDAAGIRGANASPKGLRHGFAIRAVTTGVPLTKIQKWLGHTSLATTEIYLDATGEEEHAIMRQMWTE